MRRTAALLLGSALVVSVVCAVLAARRASPSDASPLTPPGAWGTLWTASVVAALVLYAAAVLVARPRGLAAVLVATVAIQVVPLAAPLILSKDAYLYWSEARVWIVHGGNPYRQTPADYPQDPALAATSEAWRTHHTAYGPVWEVIGAAPAAAAGTSKHRAELAYRALAVLGVLVAVALVAARTRSAWATAVLGWNPLVALHFAGGGHNDAVLAVLLVAVVLARRRAAAGGALAAATLLKAFPVILFPLEIAADPFRRGSRRFVAGFVAGALALAAVAVLLFGTGWITAGVQAANSPSGLGLVHWLELAGLRYRYAGLLSTLAFAVVYGALLVDAWRHTRARLSLAAAALCITAAQVRPWYAIWPAALAAAEVDVAGAAATVALTAYLLLADAVPL